jgi:competence ComEA-like helix-hairpin-helix protein
MKKYVKMLAMVGLVSAFSASLAFAQADSMADASSKANAPVALKADASAQVASKVNINKATVEQLTAVKGLEPYAIQIVEYRDKNGPFKKLEDIMTVKGIDAKTFDLIKNLLTV